MMMKKLLIFVLVLGLASTANALLQLSVNGATDGPENVTVVDLEPSETVVIDVYSDQPLPDEFWLVVDAGGTGLVDILGWTLNIPPAPITMVLTDYGAGWYNGAMPEPSATAGIGSWFDIELHCLGEGDVDILLTDPTSYVLIDTVTLHQVPEPATMLLLGLGGLFLRRRK
jgi:hypothetical protein